MRNIKFRGLRTTDKEWVYGNLITIDNKPAIQYETIDFIDGAELNGTGWDYVNECSIGEFTGLFDRNRKEIYEGDILRYPPRSDWEKNNFVSYEVFFHDGDCCDDHIGWQINRIHYHGSVCGSFVGYNMKPSTTGHLEVIGNIHEISYDNRNEIQHR